ncbi:MAG: hypothetical protein IPG10_20625 [Flavobacteriales bacterium]|nr:hypothetical protein [Flavobacteriales bacterium]
MEEPHVTGPQGSFREARCYSVTKLPSGVIQIRAMSTSEFAGAVVAVPDGGPPSAPSVLATGAVGFTSLFSVCSVAGAVPCGAMAASLAQEAVEEEEHVEGGEGGVGFHGSWFLVVIIVDDGPKQSRKTAVRMCR